MRILVISDTHKKIDRVLEVLSQETHFDHICHLGDHTQDAQDIESIYRMPITYVKGNCDYYEFGVSDEAILKVGKYNILLTHGHQYHVKSTTTQLKKILKAQRANVVLFGHSHRAVLEYCENGVLFNPGSITFPRDGKPSYGVIEVNRDDEITFEIIRTQ